MRKAHGLRAQQPRSLVPRTTNSDPALRAAPNRVWVGDTAYLPRQGGWLYLAVWLDRCSRKSEALRRALAVRRPPAGLAVHSDQGSQYAATRF